MEKVVPAPAWRWELTADCVGCPCCDGFALETVAGHRLQFKKIYRCPLGHTFYCYLPRAKPTAAGTELFYHNMVTVRVEERIELVTPPRPAEDLFSKITPEERNKLIKKLCFPRSNGPDAVVYQEPADEELPEWSLTGRNYSCLQCGQRCHEVYSEMKSSSPAIYRYRCVDGHTWWERERFCEANWKPEDLYRDPPEDWQYIWAEP